MPSIRFFYEDIDFKITHPRKTQSWLKAVLQAENKKLSTVNYIFCSDAYLLEINIQYLNHNTYTDIITFDGSDQPDLIEGDIYISIDRVKENAKEFDSTLDNELHRVIIHGVLHLIGYNDKNSKQKLVMRRKEDAYLSLR